LFLYSKTLILEFLQASPNKVVKLYIDSKSSPNPLTSRIIRLAKDNNVPCVETDIKNVILKKRINTKEAKEKIPLILEISNFQYSSIEEIESRKTKLPLIVFAYKVKDPRNLGAILRVASAFDSKGVIITSKDSCLVNDTVINCSRNAPIPVARVLKIYDTINYLTQKGYQLFCLDVRGKVLINNLKNFITHDKFLLILGGEKGVDPKLKELSLTISIPIKNVESLNTSNALAIFLYHLNTIIT